MVLRKRLRRLVCAALAAIALVPPAAAEITQTINYQGFLLSKLTNLPVETPQAVKFVIYDSPTGGTARFTESRCKVPVNKGRYDVEIGSLTAGGVPASLFTAYQDLWLEVQLDPDGDCSGAYEAMVPRVRLQASPYSFNSLYASTSSAATPLFRADVIGALPQTTFGSVTISTNLFVQGGISVGSISPGQKLSVAGVVESTGNWPACGDPSEYTCGFKFPDGTIQLTAAANTMWSVSGSDLYSINPGNVAIGENNPVPLARLHVSTAAGESGDLLLLSTGTSKMFRVNGLGQVYGGSYYGLGSTLTGIVVSTGSTMTGQLTLLNSSMTVTSSLGVSAPRLRLLDNVELSTTTAARQGGVYISTNVWLPAGAKYYGDGSQLTNVTTSDSSKVLKSGDTMTGQLTIRNSTLTVTGDAFSVAGSTFSVLGGSVAVGGSSYPVRLSVTGGLLATSSVTAQGQMYAQAFNAQSVSAPSNFYGIYASTAHLWGFGDYSLVTDSGVKVNAGVVSAPYFSGNGSLLTNVYGTDASRVLKAGDTMTGNLQVLGSSLTVASYGAQTYALTVASAASANNYTLAVTTSGYVGVLVNAPAAPLDVRGRVQVSNNAAGDAQLYLYSDSTLPPSYTGAGVIRWSNYGLSASGGGISQGALGFPADHPRDLVYRSNGSDIYTGGQEVFRIASDDNAYWKFGIGTGSPEERFHVAANMLVGTSAASPILYVSTASGRVSVDTITQSHALTVNGGIMAVSSITAQAGFFGDGSGIYNIGAGSLPQQIRLSTITAVTGSAYNAVVFTSNTYVNAKLAVGGIFTPAADLHVQGTLRVDNKPPYISPAVLSIYPYGGDGFIKWDDGTAYNKGVLGMVGGSYDLVYKAAGASGVTSFADGVEVFRVKQNGEFLMGDVGGLTNYVPQEHFRVLSNMAVGAVNSSPVLFVSTGTGSVGISTGTPRERMHIASSMLVGQDRGTAALYVSTASGFTGVGTGSPRALLEVGNGNILAAGSYTGTASLPVNGAGTRLMWLPGAAAFRAGGVENSQWDNIGNYSAALGYANIAYGTYSTAFGEYNVSSGTYASVLGGFNNSVSGIASVVGGGSGNYVSEDYSSVPGGRYNVVQSSFSFAGGYNNHLMLGSVGTFAWGYDDVHSTLFDIANPLYVTEPYLFLVDPGNVKHYKVGVRTASPQAALDVNGDAQFGSGVNKSTFTAEGYWQPRSMTTAQLQAAVPPGPGAVAFNSSINDLCVSTGSAAGQWALMGSRGAGNCY